MYYTNIELDYNSPKIDQPKDINVVLKPHQLSAIFKAYLMERDGIVKYNFPLENNHYYNNNYYLPKNNKEYDGNISISTNVGIIGDIVGYGKTLLSLGIIANNKIDEIYINNLTLKTFNNHRTYSYLNIQSSNYLVPNDNQMINSTLVIVPRGPVFSQWENTIKNNTNLKLLSIDNLLFIKKNLPVYNGNNMNEIYEYFNQFDVVLIKNTTLKILIDYYSFPYYNAINIIKGWKRIMIDEAHDIINKIPNFRYYFLWLISGTYQELLKKTNNCNSNTIIYPLKEFLHEDYICFLLLKNNKDYVKNSFNVPLPVEKYYLCKLQANIRLIKNFISSSILEKINANDITGIIKELGGKNETEKDLIDLVSKELKKELHNKEVEKNYILNLDIPPDVKTLRIKNIDIEINNQLNKIKDLTERISELSTKTCSICMDLYTKPIMLECTHIYCGSCLINWLSINNNQNCPSCRKTISHNKMIAIVDTKTDENRPDELLSKEECFIKIVKNKPDGKFLVFSKNDNSFNKIKIKMDEVGIKYEILKGNTNHMVSILNRFKKGEINIILLNTQYAGSGIDICCATDIIIFHSMGLDKHQAIGRALRVGQTEQIYIHNLCYEHEIPDKI